MVHFSGKSFRHGEKIRRERARRERVQRELVRRKRKVAHAKTLPREDAQEGLQVGLSRMLRA